MFIRIIWALAALVALVQANGELAVLHTPDSVIFKGNKEINQSLLKEVLSAGLGLTVKQGSTWNGMSITGPFNLPEAAVVMAIEGIDSLGVIKGKKYPLVVDENEETTWQAVSGRLEKTDNDNTLVRIYLGDGLDALGQSALGELKPTSIDESSLKALSLKNDEDRKFLEEIQLLRAIAKKVPSAITADDKPDVYWLVVSGLKPVYDIHGKNSAAAKEALTLVNEALHDVSKAFMDVYKNKVLIAAFTNDASQVRNARSTVTRQRRDVAKDKENQTDSTKNLESNSVTPKPTHEEEKEEKDVEEKNNKENNNSKDESEDKKHENLDNNTHSNTHDTNNSSKKNETVLKKYNFTHYDNETMEDGNLNLAKKYNENYAVTFNIILWFMVIFFFSLLAICIFIAEMDPGRDSIIYRMTSNRMKKDN